MIDRTPQWITTSSGARFLALPLNGPLFMHLTAHLRRDESGELSNDPDAVYSVFRRSVVDWQGAVGISQEDLGPYHAESCDMVQPNDVQRVVYQLYFESMLTSDEKKKLKSQSSSSNTEQSTTARPADASADGTPTDST